METQTKNNISVDELNEVLVSLQDAYNKNRYPSLEQRKTVLQSLKKSLISHEQEFYQALNEDYGYRSEFDSLNADLLPIVKGINYAIKRLRKWMKPSRRHAGLVLAPSRVEVQYQPVGVVGIISPWNFPLLLSLSPAIQAIAAGNRVMIKLSEFTPKTNKVIIKATESIRDHLVIIEGEHEIGAAFSALPFNHIVFTGSTTVGGYVAQAAAKNLTPVTLELGGKSPVIFADDANWETAMDAVILGKALNSGQVCVAPDYAFVPRSKEVKFIELFKQRYKSYFTDSKNTNEYSHIIDQKQYDRLQNMLKDAIDKGVTVHHTQTMDSAVKNKIFHPHLLTDVTDDMEVMKEEIFGSILPVLPYDSIDECIDYINSKPRPLSLYIMSSNKDTVKKVLTNTHSGGVCVNDTIMQVIAEDAPFGGTGDSGIGHYHGQEGFQQLSKIKTVVTSKAWLPKNAFFLKNRDFITKIMRKFLLR